MRSKAHDRQSSTAQWKGSGEGDDGGREQSGGWLEIEEAGDVTEEEIDTSRGSKGTGVKTNL